MPPRRQFTRGPGRVGRLATGLGALAVLAGLTAGLPLLLQYATTVMLPHGWTPFAELPDALTLPDDGDLFVQAVIGVGWCTWAVFTLLVVSEVGRRLLGRQPPTRSRVRTPHGLAGLLVAAAAALATSPISSAHAAALPVVAADSDPLPDDDQTPPAGPPARPSHVLHLVERGQGLLDLEEMYGVPWQRIAEANYTVEQPDGGRLEPGRTVIHAGWQLRIPTIPVAHTIDRPDEADHDERPVYEVAPGDWMWHIAGRYLGHEERYLEIADLNPQLVARYGDDFPDHIQPGDRLTLPTDAHDRGERAHATGALITTAPPREPEPAPPEEAVEPSRPPTPQTPPAEPTTPAPAATGTATPTPASPTPAVSTTPTPTTAGLPTNPADGPPGPGDEPAPTPEDDSGPSAVVPIAFGAALIAATLAVTAAVKLRGRGAAGDPRVGRRGHRRGHRPHHVDNGTVEQRLQAASQPLDVDRLDTALRALATGLARRPGRLPDIIGAHVVDGDLHLLLTDANEQPPPPWQANGTLWTLTGGDLPPAAGGTLAALPTLVTVGSQAHHPGAPAGGEHLLLDLERLGCLSITGDPDAARDLLRYLASELAMNTWADDVEIVCAGWTPEQAEMLTALKPDRVQATGSTTQQVSQLRQRVQIATDTLENAGAADALAGRVRDLAGDSWMPTVALVCDPQPGDLDTIADLADELRQVGRCAVAVVTTGTVPTRDGQPDAVHTITVTADRAVHIPFLGTTLAAAGLPAHELEQLARVINAARDGAEEPVPPAPEPEPWAVGTDAAGALLPPQDIPGLDLDEYAEEELDAGDEAGPAGALGLVDAEQPPAHTEEPEPAVGQPHAPAAPAGAVTIGEPAAAPPSAPTAAAPGEADPTMDDDLAAWHQPVADRPRIRVLGPVAKATEVIDAPGQPPKPGRLLLLAEVLVYLAQCGRRGASTAQLDADIWPGQEVRVSYRRATLSRARAWAGKRADGTPWLAEFHYKLEDGYLLDWHLFRRLRARGQSRGPDGAADLRAALDLVRGMPLAEFERIASTTRSPYNWLPTSDIDPDHLAAAIVDTATELAERYLAAGDTTGARWAVDKAWQADPDRNYDQPWQILLRVHAHDRHLAELEACVHELMRLREAEVEEPGPRYLCPAAGRPSQRILGPYPRTRLPGLGHRYRQRRGSVLQRQQVRRPQAPPTRAVLGVREQHSVCVHRRAHQPQRHEPASELHRAPTVDQLIAGNSRVLTGPPLVTLNQPRRRRADQQLHPPVRAPLRARHDLGTPPLPPVGRLAQRHGRRHEQGRAERSHRPPPRHHVHHTPAEQVTPRAQPDLFAIRGHPWYHRWWLAGRQPMRQPGGMDLALHIGQGNLVGCLVHRSNRCSTHLNLLTARANTMYGTPDTTASTLCECQAAAAVTARSRDAHRCRRGRSRQTSAECPTPERPWTARAHGSLRNRITWV